MKVRLRWQRYYSATLGLARRQSTPIVVYQMGKVGSSSVRNSLLLSNDPRTRLVLHCHDLVPLRHRAADAIAVDDDDRREIREEIEEARRVFTGLSWLKRLEWRLRERLFSERIYREIVQPGRPAKFITLVRDPVATSLSMFFQVFDRYAGTPYRAGAFATDEIIRMFKERYRPWRPLSWFDIEIRSMLGIDVYDHVFPQTEGYQHLSAGNFELLILKSNIDDSLKEHVIAHYLGLSGFRLSRSNIGSQKNYAEQYDELKRRIRFEAPFLSRMYDSRYARHFYSEQEIDEFRRRWADVTL